MTTPPPTSPNQMPAIWDATAPGYAEDARLWDGFAEQALRLLPVDDAHDVLDVATGPGTLAFLAATRARQVTAVDFSRGMIAQLETRAARLGISNVDASVMDAQSLDFPDGRFDAAFCLFAYMFFPNRARAFAELRRVVRPGGRALIATWSPIDRRPMMQLGFEAMAAALPDMPRPAKGDLQDPDECVAEMTGGGFRDVVAHRFVSSLRAASADDYLTVLVRSAAPMVALKSRLGPDAWARAEQTMLEFLRERIPATGADLASEAILTVGTA